MADEDRQERRLIDRRRDRGDVVGRNVDYRQIARSALATTICWALKSTPAAAGSQIKVDKQEKTKRDAAETSAFANLITHSSPTIWL